MRDLLPPLDFSWLSAAMMLLGCGAFLVMIFYVSQKKKCPEYDRAAKLPLEND